MMIDLGRSISPLAFGPRFNVEGVAPQPPQAPAEATPPPPFQGQGNDELGRNEFLQLLVAQMKNQDPLNPMDGQEMAAQLAQFSQVEQLIEINEGMQAVSAGQEALGGAINGLSELTVAQGDAMAKLLEQSMAINTVGRTGVLDGNQMFVGRDGSGAITIDAGVLKGVGVLNVLDEGGQVIASASVDKVKEGMQSIPLEDFTFDPPLEPGRYTYQFSMTNDQGATVPVKTFTTGRITGLRYEDGQPVLMLGDSLSVPFSSLLQLRN